MRVVVTGGAGYIGSVVSACLIDAGHAVTVVDDLRTGHRDAVHPAARFVELPLADTDGLVEALTGAEAVLHFAALSLVGESVAAPLTYYRGNVAGSLSLLEAMARSGVDRLVFSSTAACYGEPDVVPITEDAPTVPTNPYGATKLAVDRMIAAQAAASGLAAISLRYFNVAGAHGALGERHGVETHLIPLALATVAGERGPLSVFGTDYPTPDGTCIRDYIHVTDLAAAHLAALAAVTAGAHRVINLGSGTGFSVRQVLDTVADVTGSPVSHVDAPRRPGDPAVLIASSALAADVLGWRPQRSLDEMVADAWAARRPAGGARA